MKRWPIMPLGEVCFAKSGNSKIIKGTLRTHNDGNLFSAYSATGQDVFSDGFDFDGDGIVISAVGARCGKCFLASGRWRAVANTHVILPKPDKVNVKFLWYLLNNESFWVKGGTAQPFVKVLDSLKKLIVVPPLVEQERIVKLLDEADELRKLRAQADHRTNELIPALFHEMFGDPISNTRNWIVKSLNEVLDVLYRYPTFYGTSYIQDGVPVARIGNILPSNTLDPDVASYVRVPHSFSAKFPKTILKYGDLVVAVRGDTTGKIGIVPSSLEGANISPNLIRLSPNILLIINEYLLWLLLLAPSFISSKITDTAKKSITATNIGHIELPLPPLLLQKEFAQQVAEIRELESIQSASRKRLDDLFQSMLHRAFEGKL